MEPFTSLLELKWCQCHITKIFSFQQFLVANIKPPENFSLPRSRVPCEFFTLISTFFHQLKFFSSIFQLIIFHITEKILSQKIKAKNSSQKMSQKILETLKKLYNGEQKRFSETTSANFFLRPSQNQGNVSPKPQNFPVFSDFCLINEIFRRRENFNFHREEHPANFTPLLASFLFVPIFPIRVTENISGHKISAVKKLAEQYQREGWKV